MGDFVYTTQEDCDWANALNRADQDCFPLGACPPLFDGALPDQWDDEMQDEEKEEEEEEEKEATEMECDSHCQHEACEYARHLKYSMEVDTYDADGNFTGQRRTNYNISFCGARMVVDADGRLIFENF